MPPSTFITAGSGAILAPTALGFTGSGSVDPTAYLPYGSPQIITASGTWRHPKPGFPISITYSAIGGGGGGAGSGYGGGGGGGSGRITLMSRITVTQDIAVTIGAGGSAGASASTSAATGGSGGTTTFNGVSVAGGTGGQNSYETPAPSVTSGAANGGAGGFGGGGGYPTSATPVGGYKVAVGGAGSDFTGGGGCAGLTGGFTGGVGGASAGGHLMATDGSNNLYGYLIPYWGDVRQGSHFTAFAGEPNGGKITNTGGGGGQASLLYPFFLQYGCGGRGATSGAGTAGSDGAVFIWYNRS